MQQASEKWDLQLLETHQAYWVASKIPLYKPLSSDYVKTSHHFVVWLRKSICQLDSDVDDCFWPKELPQTKQDIGMLPNKKRRRLLWREAGPSTCIYIYISICNYSGVRNALCLRTKSFWIGYRGKFIWTYHLLVRESHRHQAFRCFTCCDQNINPGTMGVGLPTFIRETILAATT